MASLLEMLKTSMDAKLILYVEGDIFGPRVLLLARYCRSVSCFFSKSRFPEMAFNSLYYQVLLETGS
jgi:hypothetical protein